jgi:hypothetical protein
MDYSYALMDLRVYGRQEKWEDSPPGWPQECTIRPSDSGAPDWRPASVWPGGRPIAQWLGYRPDAPTTSAPDTSTRMKTKHKGAAVLQLNRKYKTSKAAQQAP